MKKKGGLELGEFKLSVWGSSIEKLFCSTVKLLKSFMVEVALDIQQGRTDVTNKEGRCLAKQILKQDRKDVER